LLKIIFQTSFSLVLIVRDSQWNENYLTKIFFC
jgi:hypothetical protein